MKKFIFLLRNAFRVMQYYSLEHRASGYRIRVTRRLAPFTVFRVEVFSRTSPRLSVCTHTLAEAKNFAHSWISASADTLQDDEVKRVKTGN